MYTSQSRYVCFTNSGICMLTLLACRVNLSWFWYYFLVVVRLFLSIFLFFSVFLFRFFHSSFFFSGIVLVLSILFYAQKTHTKYIEININPTWFSQYIRSFRFTYTLHKHFKRLFLVFILFFLLVEFNRTI